MWLDSSSGNLKARDRLASCFWWHSEGGLLLCYDGTDLTEFGRLGLCECFLCLGCGLDVCTWEPMGEHLWSLASSEVQWEMILRWITHYLELVEKGIAGPAQRNWRWRATMISSSLKNLQQWVDFKHLPDPETRKPKHQSNDTSPFLFLFQPLWPPLPRGS